MISEWKSETFNLGHHLKSLFNLNLGLKSKQTSSSDPNHLPGERDTGEESSVVTTYSSNLQVVDESSCPPCNTILPGL